MKLVLIEWVDSYGCSPEWEEIDPNRQATPLICRSVGWLLIDNDDCKVIVPHVAYGIDGAKHSCGDMTIPTDCIRKIFDLDDPE